MHNAYKHIYFKCMSELGYYCDILISFPLNVSDNDVNNNLNNILQNCANNHNGLKIISQHEKITY